MKKLANLLLLLMLISLGVEAQNVAINKDGAAPDASAMLDVSDTASGILIPRMTAAQRIAISSPANGLLVFQTDGTAGFYAYLSSITAWSRITTDSTSALKEVLALGNDANADTIFNLNALAIGTSKADADIHVSGNNLLTGVVESSHSQGTWLVMRNSSTNGNYHHIISSGNTASLGAGKLFLGTGTSATSSNIGLVIDYDSVGIGTAYPTEPLHISSALQTLLC